MGYVIVGLVSILIGGLTGFVIRMIIGKVDLNSAENRAKIILRESELEAESKKKELLLDVVYLNYDQDRETGYFWPKNTELSGNLIKGTIKLERSGILSFDPLPLSVFHLDIPPHFKVEQVR